MLEQNVQTSGLPSQIAESGYYAVIDALQTVLADSAVVNGASLRHVPDWTVQVTLFLIGAKVQGIDIPSTEEFDAFAESSAQYESWVFNPVTTWTANNPALHVCTRLLSGYDLHSLLVILGRALDYGRTIEWTVDLELPKKRRNLATAKSEGMFYTPAFVAQHLARRTVGAWQGLTPPSVVDPACGGGILLLAAVENLLERYSPHQVLESIYGVDLDPVAAEVSAIATAAACGLWTPGSAPPTWGCNFLVGDSFGGPIVSNSAEVGSPAITWEASFPELFANSHGFHVALMNPPYGRYKFDSDWLIAKDMHFDQSLAEMRMKVRNRSSELRRSSLYPLSSKGVLDKSRVGLERAMQLVSDGGSLGVVVPSTINADATSYALRRCLLTRWQIDEINEFPETSRLFYDVNQSISVVVARKNGPTKAIMVRSNIRREEQLSEPGHVWPVALIQKLSSKSAIPVRAGDAEDILQLIHSHPSMGSYREIENLRGEVDVTVFRESISSDPMMTPLVRGDQVDRYQSGQHSDKLGFVNTSDYLSRLQNSQKLSHFRSVRIVGRQCSYLYRHRRLSFSVVSEGKAVANSCNYIVTQDESLRYYALALLNSQLLNWRFKLTNSNNHVSNAEIDEFPMPDPHRLREGLFEAIVVRARRLDQHYCERIDEELDQLVFEAYGLNASQRQRIQTDEAVPISRQKRVRRGE